ncbi:MAG: transcription antitermination factor NusB [Thermogutta sp.]|nr:transcription antitermination factor NusB [Thermogutta sp.]
MSKKQVPGPHGAQSVTTHPAPDRRHARVLVLQLLFQDDLNPRNNPAKGEEMIQNGLRQPDLVRFAKDLLAGVRRNRRELDERLQRVAENWTLDRMAAVDRNVLRLGAYELLYTDTPPSVVIDEAVELAKSFGTEHSGAFVNGILDRLLREQKAASDDRRRELEASP